MLCVTSCAQVMGWAGRHYSCGSCWTEEEGRRWRWRGGRRRKRGEDGGRAAADEDGGKGAGRRESAPLALPQKRGKAGARGNVVKQTPAPPSDVVVVSCQLQCATGFPLFLCLTVLHVTYTHIPLYNMIQNTGLVGVMKCGVTFHGHGREICYHFLLINPCDTMCLHGDTGNWRPGRS